MNTLRGILRCIAVGAIFAGYFVAYFLIGALDVLVFGKRNLEGCDE